MASDVWIVCSCGDKTRTTLSRWREKPEHRHHGYDMYPSADDMYKAIYRSEGFIEKHVTSESGDYIYWICQECGRNGNPQSPDTNLDVLFIEHLDRDHDRLNRQTDMVNHPPHYTSGKIEVADFILDQQLDFFLGNVVKYVSRAGKKDPDKYIEDLKKAQWYLNKYIEAYSDSA